MRSRTGVALFGTGIALDGAGLITMVVGFATGGDNDCKSAGKCIWAIGVAAIAVGIPLSIVGGLMMKKKPPRGPALLPYVDRYNVAGRF